MRRVKFLETIARFAEVLQVFTVFIVFENDIAPIAVRQKDIAIASYGNSGRF